ncbi:MAG: 1-deoxy-D-xylulose-5-phosphate reductoisomerase [Gammaproteobacteria bacterium]
MNRVALLGATGSIGRQTLDVMSLHPGRFSLFAVAANRSVEGMLPICLSWKPTYAVMCDETAAQQLSEALLAKGSDTTVLSGDEGLCFIAAHPDVDTVMTGIVGGAGLRASMAAAESGKKILLANKESLVMAGPLFMEAASRSGATIIPVDSEHNAVFQCWNDTRHAGKQSISRVYLTASGGPFLRRSIHELNTVTPEEAVRHPRWNMGAKISVDSATLANKALELMEAHYLFGLSFDELGVLIHPQSTVHALVEYKDGSVLTHLGEPDMRVPISYALGWPDRIESGVTAKRLLDNPLSLQFEALQPGQFRCFDLAQTAMRAGQADMIIFNAANEVAVQAFLDKQLSFMGIPALIETLLSVQSRPLIASLADVFALDKDTRRLGATHLANGAFACPTSS